MKIFRWQLLLFSCLFACQPPTNKTKHAGKEPYAGPPAALLVSCDGIGRVKLSDSYADLQKKFPKEVLAFHDNNVSGQFLSIKERSPEQLNVYFKEQKPPFVHIKRIETAADNAPYLSADSLHVGMTLRELVNKNGHMPVTFRNVYAVKNPGLILSFNNGDLQKAQACLSLRMDVSEIATVYVRELNQFKKKDTLQSSDDMLNRITTILGAFVVQKNN